MDIDLTDRQNPLHETHRRVLQMTGWHSLATAQDTWYDRALTCMALLGLAMN